MSLKAPLFAVLGVLVLGGCATIPVGPSVMVLPGTGKSFDEFQSDDATCRDWAAYQTGTSPQQSQQNDVIAGATIGTLVGAGAGAVIGAAVGNPGAGAAIGAGSGLLIGSASGAEAGYGSQYELQRRFDNAFQQCMYARGNQIPVDASMRSSLNGPPPARSYAPPPRNDDPIPPPPPGPPPPPPPS